MCRNVGKAGSEKECGASATVIKIFIKITVTIINKNGYLNGKGYLFNRFEVKANVVKESSYDPKKE